MDAEDKDEMLTILQMLVREGLLSDEKFKQFGELEDPDFGCGRSGRRRLSGPSFPFPHTELSLGTNFRWKPSIS